MCYSFVFFPIKNYIFEYFFEPCQLFRSEECCSQNGELDRFETNHPKLKDMDEFKLVLPVEMTLSWDLFLIP